jgi:hypothetical protein
MQRHEGYCKNKKSCTKINIEQDAKRNQMGIIMHNQIENEKHICIKQTRTQCFRKKIGWKYLLEQHKQSKKQYEMKESLLEVMMKMLKKKRINNNFLMQTSKKM